MASRTTLKGPGLFGRRVSAGRLRRLSVTIACHRQGSGSAAEVLARSLDQTPNRTLLAMAPSAPASSPPCSALRDPSFSFVNALSVAAWGRTLRLAG